MSDALAPWLPTATPAEPRDDAPPVVAVPPGATPRMSNRVRQWIRTLHRDPSAEDRAMRERRQRLLDALNRAVAEAPDDVPIKNIIERLNRHRDD